MSATRRALDTIIIIIAIVLLWQGLAHWVGETALPGPAPTFVYLAHFVPTTRFAENAAATAIAFALALLLAYGPGLAIGVWMARSGCRARSASRS